MLLKDSLFHFFKECFNSFFLFLFCEAKSNRAMEQLTPSSFDHVMTGGITSPHGFKPERLRIGSRLIRGGQQNWGMIRCSDRVVEKISSREKESPLIICDSPVKTLFDSPNRPFVGPGKFITLEA